MTCFKKRGLGDQPRLDMTPMIDVVFLLLIFFVVSLKQEDILTKLSVSRPGTSIKHEKDPPRLNLINIDVCASGFLLNGRPMEKDVLEKHIGRLAEFSRTASVMIKCTSDSQHSLLVQALDICNQHRMTNLSVFTL